MAARRVRFAELDPERLATVRELENRVARTSWPSRQSSDWPSWQASN
jgi:hypothetical protein